ncbi:MAG: ester cyclase [Leptospirales bacterium]|nr:ester cyclase [Leptospirales bacterium]
MTSSLEQNKNLVRRFNLEVIEEGRVESFQTLVADDFINQTAPPGAARGAESLLHFFTEILRPAFPDLRVEIHDQVAEGDRVVTRKSIHGTHLGPFMGIPASGKKTTIEVIDIVRVRDGKYVEHWGANNLQSVIAMLATPVNR